ncbi:MAG: recombination mediator RecR [Cyclobacteriaceae bacterium]
MEYPSKLVEKAVGEISKLPGIGKRTALRLVFHLLKEEKNEVQSLSTALVDLRENTIYCSNCHSISDSEQCHICTNSYRVGDMVCVVEDTKDIIAIESTSQYNGLYHVLGGIISPMDGVGPQQLTIQSLVERVEKKQVKEVILAISPTMEGDTTAYYITKKLKHTDVKVSTIARGIPVGGELEYTDEVTLGRSIQSRIQFEIQD